EIKIRVKASSVNPIDFKTRSGSLFILSGWKFLGADFCGVVIARGSSVKHIQLGDEVYGLTNAATKGGAYGEVMCCQASRVAIKPKRLNHQQSAAVPLAGLTAYQALHREGNMKAGMRVLVTGA